MGRRRARGRRRAPRSLRRPTERFWRDWLGDATIPDHRFRPYIERSALALKGLSYAPTGAIMAASTTSLPETPGGERNWDYRYTWIRDSGFMLRALHGLGFDWEAFEYFAFMIDAVSGRRRRDRLDLQIMYGIGGEHDLTEHTLDHLSGYLDSRPVRIGNGAYDQHQHDVWGMLLDSVATHLRHGGQLGPPGGTASPASSTTAIAARPNPTRASGRCAATRSTSSRRRSCAGSRRIAARTSPRREATTNGPTRWQTAADAIRAEVLAKGVDRSWRVPPALRRPTTSTRRCC